MSLSKESNLSPRDRHAAIVRGNRTAYEAAAHALRELQRTGAIVGRDQNKLVFYAGLIDGELASIFMNVTLEGVGHGTSVSLRVFPGLRSDGSFAFMDNRLELFLPQDGVEWPYVRELRDLVREVAPLFSAEMSFAMAMLDAKLVAMHKNLFGARRG